jgi:pyruvate-ferredoxin/flavodoxin oxidoreductase
VAFGAKDAQTLKAFVEAESFNGPSLIIAYGHCIAHGYDMAQGLEHQKLAAESGYWPLYRFDPRREAAGQPALTLDSGSAKADVSQLMNLESRFQAVAQHDAAHYDDLLNRARHQITKRLALYKELATGHAGPPVRRS